MILTSSLAVVAQASVVGYAVWAVHNRNDRRKVPDHLAGGLHGMALFGLVLLGLAWFLSSMSGDRRFLAVRDIYELGCVAGSVATVLSIRILKGAPYDRKTMGCGND